MKDLSPFYRHKNVQANSLALEIVIFNFLKSVLSQDFYVFIVDDFSSGAAHEATTTVESKQTKNFGEKIILYLKFLN